MTLQNIIAFCSTGARILAVEDMGIQVRLLQIALEQANYEFLAARDGKEALEKATTLEPDLILLDLELPDLNGFQVLHQLRQDSKTQHIPVIMLTAHAKDAAFFEENRREGDVFMTKPYNPTELITTIERILSVQAQRGPSGDRLSSFYE
ncbi:MAG TPA: response regulator [Chthonomonadaceae bacterium]|nr:response regulator [Chthonomonadaceae bacterium]